jgi:predicted metal-dependent hydrolase
MLMSDYPMEYIHYLAEYFGSRDYFECHEIMEEYWKEHPDSEYKTCWLVLIRIPVCLYHARRGNWKGAVKLMGKAAEEADARQFDQLGLDGNKLVAQLKKAKVEWNNPDVAYMDIELPIMDVRLLEAAQRRCLELGYTWGIHGLEAGDSIIHRHRTRDRSEVVNTRMESAKRKALSRGIPNKDSRR